MVLKIVSKLLTRKSLSKRRSWTTCRLVTLYYGICKMIITRNAWVREYEGRANFCSNFLRAVQIDCKSRCQFFGQFSANLPTASSPMLCHPSSTLKSLPFCPYAKCYIIYCVRINLKIYLEKEKRAQINVFDILCWMRIWICKSDFWTKSCRRPILATNLARGRARKTAFAILSSTD